MLESIDHINIVVTDLDSMADFYSGKLGLTITKRANIRGAWIERVVGLPGVDADVIYLEASSGLLDKLRTGPRVELIRYNHPTATRPSHLCEPNLPGLRHLAFRVSDLESFVRELAARGVRFFNEVQQVPDEQVTYAAGVRKRLVYFHDPEGNLLELCEYA